MANRIPTERRHGEEYRAALTRSRQIITRLRVALAARGAALVKARRSRDAWKRRAIKSGGMRL